MKRYVKYLRKSRFDRDYAELSVEETLKRHEAILDELAEKKGYHIAKTYYEVVSGESISARPEIQKMLEEVSAGLYEGVLVVDVERLARGNGADQAYISQVFQFSGTKIITPLKIYDPSNEYDEEYFEFGLFMSRREYKTINRRLIRGRQSSASEGKYVGSIPPYGYQRVKIPDEKGYTLEPHPEEAAVVRKIFDMFVHRQGTKIIANTLNDLKIPTRHGGLWGYSTIAGILKNPVYAGKIKRGWCKQVKTIENGVVKKRTKHLTNPDDYEIYQGVHPALVDESVFLEAQSIREDRIPNTKVKDEFVLQNALAGLIFCANCGQRIARTTLPRNKKPPRLRCVNQRNCHNSSCYYDEVEKEVITALGTWLEGYKVKVETGDFTDEITFYKNQIEKIDIELQKIETQIDNAYDLVEQGIYSVDVFKSRKDKLDADLKANQQEKEKISRSLSRLEEDKNVQVKIIPQTETLLNSYDEMTPEERNNLLKAVLYRIEYKKESGGKIEIDIYPRLPKI